jgi:aspartate 1-decarboxylase
LRWFLRSKITHAIVKEAEVDYIGSITIDEDLIDKSGLMVGEKVLVVSNTSGARLETYVISGKRGSGIIGMNGAAAHLIQVGEEIIIMGFELADTPTSPKIILVNKDNKFEKYL